MKTIKTYDQFVSESINSNKRQDLKNFMELIKI